MTRCHVLIIARLLDEERELEEYRVVYPDAQYEKVHYGETCFSGKLQKISCVTFFFLDAERERRVSQRAQHDSPGSFVSPTHFT